MLEDLKSTPFFRFLNNHVIKSIIGNISILILLSSVLFPSSFYIFVSIASLLAFYGVFKDKSKIPSIASLIIIIVLCIYDAQSYNTFSPSKEKRLLTPNAQDKEDNLTKVSPKMTPKEVRELTEKLYYSLLEFKGTTEFKEKGFSKNSKYHYWLVEIEKLDTNENSAIILSECGFVIGDIKMLGSEYVSSGGKETEYSQWAKDMINNGLKGIKSYN